jgi:hypothetical protein
MHQDVTCKSCGKIFVVDGDHDPQAPDGTFPAPCPYCEYVNPILWPQGGVPLVNPK